MKKFISIIVLLLTISIGALAQKKLGDYIEIGGVPAFVFHLDETREHGLAMFQHTIYPPKNPSLFFLLHLLLIPFSCCCCQYHLKRFVVTGDTLHQFFADSPCLI